ncbi:MAG: hypothetical protein ABSF52_15310 [Syntrophobacteraceae bacterium]|jgi:hypothetical protein
MSGIGPCPDNPKAESDFPLHFELGRRFAEGVFIYEGGLDFVYPPFWALIHAPLRIFCVHAAQVIVYRFAIVAMATLVRTLQRLSEQPLPLSLDAAFRSTSLAILLGSLFWAETSPRQE